VPSQDEKHTMPESTRDQIFISYSHKDKKWLEKLQTIQFSKRIHRIYGNFKSFLAVICDQTSVRTFPGANIMQAHSLFVGPATI
jgi:hypothetical protein